MVMFVRLNFILLCTYLVYCLNILLVVNARMSRIGFYKVSKSNVEAVRRCISTMQFERDFFEWVRVSERTGSCEVSSGPMGNETTDAGYIYAKSIIQKKFFQPKIGLNSQTWTCALFGVFDIGKRIDFYVTFPERKWNSIRFSLCDVCGSDPNRLDIRFQLDSVSILEMNGQGEQYHGHEENLTGTKHDISFVAKDHNIIQVLIDGKHIFTKKTSQSQINKTKRITIQPRIIDAMSMIAIKGIGVSNMS